MKKLLLVALVILISFPSFSQTEVLDTIKYAFYVDNSQGQFGAFNAEMVEGEHFTIQSITLPPAFAALQGLYDALIGSEMGLEVGSLDRNILINITLGGLNGNNQLVVEGQPLFLYMQIDVMDLKTNQWYSPEESFYFLNGKGAYLNIPVSPAFLAFCAQNGIDINQGISFAYLITNPDGSLTWTPIGLNWSLDQSVSPWVINLKLIHFSKFGGGGKTLAPQTDVKTGSIIPDHLNLLQNYPNPFNPSTIIKYNLPESGNISLKIYNSLGKEISTLESGYKSAGEHSIEFNSINLSTGTYFYTINFNGKFQTRKMLLIK